MGDFISVIVPVYNVESYLRPCIESILNQSYKKLQIILIDDGSCDSSSKICDEYAALDARVVVIHQKNHGVTYTRQLGLRLSEGQYISFVDADDYLDSKMYEKMLKSIIDTKSDMVICDYCSVHDNKINATYQRKQSLTMDKYEALGLLASDDIRSFMCNKLYRSKILKKEDFNCKKYFEDYLCMPNIFDRCEKISYLHDVLYYYVRHGDSRTDTDNAEWLFFLATLARKRWYKKHYKFFDEACFSRVIEVGLTILEKNSLNIRLREKIKKYFNISLCKIVKNKHLNIHKKMKIVCLVKYRG